MKWDVQKLTQAQPPIHLENVRDLRSIKYHQEHIWCGKYPVLISWSLWSLFSKIKCILIGQYKIFFFNYSGMFILFLLLFFPAYILKVRNIYKWFNQKKFKKIRMVNFGHRDLAEDFEAEWEWPDPARATVYCVRAQVPAGRDGLFHHSKGWGRKYEGRGVQKNLFHTEMDSHHTCRKSVFSV